MAMVFALVVAIFGAASLVTAQTASIPYSDAPGSIKLDVPIVYGGPSPSLVQKELVGPYKLLQSAIVDLEAGTVTLPLYQGDMKKKKGKSMNIWYVLLDTSDSQAAATLGLNFSPKLAYGAPGARLGRITTGGNMAFQNGWVDFTPDFKLTPGSAPSFFPPTGFNAPSVGMDNYSPLVWIQNANAVYNAPIVAGDVSDGVLNQFCSGIPASKAAMASKHLHTKVVKICPQNGTVTLELTTGFSFGKPVLYVSTDATVALTATLEGATYAPYLSQLDGVNTDEQFGSALEALFLVTNGYANFMAAKEDKVHPQRQGLNSALAGDGSPLNVFGGIPTVSTEYSPLWDLNVGSWTDHAFRHGYVSRITDEFTYLGFVEKGYIIGPFNSTFGSFNAGLVNCPAIYRFL